MERTLPCLLAVLLHVQTSVQAQCVNGQRGPPCVDDADCLKITDCVRCGGKGFCTANPGAPTGAYPTPPPTGAYPTPPPTGAYPTPPPTPEVCKDLMPPKANASSLKPGTLPPPSEWLYLMVPLEKRHEDKDAKLDEVAWTKDFENLCLNLFPGQKPPVSSRVADSRPVCVLSRGQVNGDPHAVYYAEYNQRLHVPNLVAYVIPSGPVSDSEHTSITRDWGSAKSGFDISYGPLPASVDACCWCDSHVNKDVCDAEVHTRGHLATMSAFQPSYDDMYATNVMLNSVPTRQPFDGVQWNRYEQEKIVRAKTLAPTGLYVVAGPSLQFAGKIPGMPDPNTHVAVPAWLWSAYADLDACGTVANFCKNGGPNNGCACADGLTGAELELRIGFAVFPGLSDSCEPSGVAPAVASWEVAPGMLETWQWLLIAGILFGISLSMAKYCYGFNMSLPSPWQKAFVDSSCLPSALAQVRFLQAVFFVGLQTYDITIFWEGGYYFIYLTHWALIVETLYAVCLMIATSKAMKYDGEHIDGQDEPCIVKITMVLHALALPASLLISVIVWTALTPFWKLCLFNPGDDCVHIENAEYVIVHLVNTIVLFVTFLDGRLPFRRDMGGWFLVFATAYSIWTIIHFFLKIGIYPDGPPCPVPYPQDECPIYAIIDWHKPEQTLLVGAGLLFVLVPLVFAAWIVAAFFRDKLLVPSDDESCSVNEEEGDEESDTD